MEDVKEPCDDSKTDMSNSSGSKDLSKSLPVEAFNNFLQGKRHMLVQDFQNAVASLAKSCEMYVNHFGELAIECAEVYYLYGKALFRLSQQQAGILGGALNDGSNEENSSESEGKENEESDKNSDGEEGEENEAEGNEAEGNEAEGNELEKEEKEPSESTDSPPAVVDEGSSEAKAESNSKVKPETPEPTEASSPEKKESEKDAVDDQAPQSADDSKTEGSVEENTEVEEDDLELAWNTLETAKSIFKRRDTVESQLKVAEILQLLAEISMESDNNAAAISDLTECLEIQKKHLKPDDRILAETYYQMGLALMLDKIYPEALKNFQTTKEILELRVENLKNTPVDDADGTFASADIEAEIADLETVLLDIKEKIDDTEELICNKKKELAESSVADPGVSSVFSEKDEKTTTSKPISNITHLLKRKKPDDGVSEDSAKRIKISGVLNGDSEATPPETAKTEG